MDASAQPAFCVFSARPQLVAWSNSKLRFLIYKLPHRHAWSGISYENLKPVHVTLFPVVLPSIHTTLVPSSACLIGTMPITSLALALFPSLFSSRAQVLTIR